MSLDNEKVNAKRIRLAKKNPYNSVIRVCLDKEEEGLLCVGVKDVKQIPVSLIKKFEKTNEYILHTLDAHALGGRAIDIQVKNPITGGFMSGSSSGSAVNVFCNINDIGIGTDGGGSVLAPAMALNLYSFMSPLIEKDYVEQFSKTSTDGITFTPSIGIMTKTYSEIEKAIQIVLPYKINQSVNSDVKIIKNSIDDSKYPFVTTDVEFPDIYGERNELINFLKEKLEDCDFLVSKEGPIDMNGIGDSVYGSLGMKDEQKKSGKGMIRVVNMVNATAISIPTRNLAEGFVFICESKKGKIETMLKYAEKMVVPRTSLIEQYFNNLDMYFEDGYQGEGE